MKLLLVISVIYLAVAVAAPADKQKREILPGDPRYGTDHHHHHHHEHENEVQILKAVGGYVGSYTVPDDTEDHSFQVPQTSYGPPTYKPGKPLGSDYFAPSDATKNSNVLQVPSTSYGIPETTQVLNNNYLGPVIEEKKQELIKHTHTEQQVPSIPISSFSSIEHEEHVPHTSYGIPVVKPSFESVHVQKTIIPEVHHEVQQQPASVHKHVKTVSAPQTKVTTSHLPAQTQEIHHSSVSSFPSVHYPVTYSSYSSIPVKTVNHHVQVQVPQPYPVPVTKHVTYPVPVPHAVEVPKPYYVRVPQPVHIAVNHPYAVEVPRPVPYPVTQYVKTSVPVIPQHHVNIETIKATTPQLHANFFDSTPFQNVLDNLPNFPNPLQSFQNTFSNFELPSLPSLPFPSLPSFASHTETTVPNVGHVDIPVPPTSDSITVNNPTLKAETTFTKTDIVPPTITTHTKTHTQSVVKDTTSTNTKKDYVQPTDANGGYIY